MSRFLFIWCSELTARISRVIAVFRSNGFEMKSTIRSTPSATAPIRTSKKYVVAECDVAALCEPEFSCGHRCYFVLLKRLSLPSKNWRSRFPRGSWLSREKGNAQGNELNQAYQLDLRVIRPKHSTKPLRFVRLDHLNVFIRISSTIDTHWIKVTFMPFFSSTKRYRRLSRWDL